VSLFPWTIVSSRPLADFIHNGLSKDWPKFISSHAGLVVVGNAEELYLVRLSQIGKQKEQIRLDTVSLRCSCQ
jgi:hypothetical protein